MCCFYTSVTSPLPGSLQLTHWPVGFAEVLLQLLVEHIEISQLDVGAYAERNCLQHGFTQLLVFTTCGWRHQSLTQLMGVTRKLLQFIQTDSASSNLSKPGQINQQREVSKWGLFLHFGWTELFYRHFQKNQYFLQLLQTHLLNEH